MDRPADAHDRILDAADRVFAAEGVSAAGMSVIAAEAGCSRGTLYRYFPTRHALHLAYVERAAAAIVTRVRERTAHLGDPEERVVEAILASLAEVRASPGMAAWFASGEAASPVRMSRASDVVTRLTGTFVAGLIGGEAGDPESRLRAAWMVRVILSFLAEPGTDAEEERALVTRFVAPSISL